mgnify:FL=1
MGISTFGEYIRSLREEAGLTLETVAQKINIDTSLLGQIERNERNPTKNLIKKLSNFFDQEESYLLSEHLSDQIAFKILDEEANVEVLKTAEKKIDYLKSKKNG